MATLTYYEVIKAAHELTSTGSKATSVTVRNKIGKGSYSTIASFLREWKNKNYFMEEEKNSEGSAFVGDVTSLHMAKYIRKQKTNKRNIERVDSRIYGFAYIGSDKQVKIRSIFNLIKIEVEQIITSAAPKEAIPFHLFWADFILLAFEDFIKKPESSRSYKTAASLLSKIFFDEKFRKAMVNLTNLPEEYLLNLQNRIDIISSFEEISDKKVIEEHGSKNTIYLKKIFQKTEVEIADLNTFDSSQFPCEILNSA